jgi:hypothetical protein
MVSYFAERQSDGTAAPEPEFKKGVIGGCHARLVGCSSLLGVVDSFRSQARKAFSHAETETDPSGKKLIEHGAWCYFNAAKELEALISSHPQSSGTPVEGTSTMILPP